MQLMILNQLLLGNYFVKMKHNTDLSQSLTKKSSLDYCQSILSVSTESFESKRTCPLKIKYSTPVQRQNSLNTVPVGEFPNCHDTCDKFCPLRMTYKFQIYRYTNPCQLPFLTIRGSASARELILFLFSIRE